MREARNSQIVLDQVRVRTGIEIQIISNSEQRFLNYKAIAALDEDFDKNIRQGTAIVDVGFGSMQISLFDEKLLISTENKRCEYHGGPDKRTDRRHGGKRAF